MSGLPGKLFVCRRYRYPARCKKLRTAISGVVLRTLTACMILRRCSLVRVSAIVRTQPELELAVIELRYRRVLALDDFTGAEIAAIKASEAPAEAAIFDAELPRSIEPAIER